MLLDKNPIPESLSESYQEFIKPEKILGVRVISILGLALYLSFLIVDVFALSSQIQAAWTIRGIVIISFIFSYALTYSDAFFKYYSYIQPTPYIFAAFGITVMISLSSSADKASDVYFAGLILVLMVLFSWSHSRLRNLIATSVLIIASYLFVLMTRYENNIIPALPELLPNLFFLVSATIIGLVTLLIRDQNLRHSFLLTRQLHESLLKKTVEAIDNAYLANHDMLTGLPNRRFVMEQLEVSLTVAKEKNKILAILFLDLNGFKQINDTHGHKAGDEILIVVARRLEAAIRRNDSISRLGGDEYLIGLLLKPEQVNEIEQMKEKFVSIISEPIEFEGITMTVGTSIGIAAYPMHGDDVGVLIDIADNKMYQHKDDRRSGDARRDDDLIERPIKDKYISLDIIDEHAFDSLKKASEQSSTEFEIDFIDLPSKKESA